MKITHILAAATMIAGIGVSTAASAQDYRHHDRYERRYEHRDNRRYDRPYYRDHGRHYGWNHHGRQCRVEWRHHHRVTICYR